MAGPADSAYLRERHRLTGGWLSWGRLASALVGAALGTLVPTPYTVWVRAAGGILVTETVLYCWRFFWTAPKGMHRDALLAVSRAEALGHTLLKEAEARWAEKHRADAAVIASLQDSARKLESEVRELTSKLAVRSQNQQLANRLSELHSYGVHNILNWDWPRGDSSIEGWSSEERNWTAEVRRTLEEAGCTPQVVGHFWDIAAPRGKGRHPNPRIDVLVSMFEERLERLWSIIALLAEVPSRKS